MPRGDRNGPRGNGPMTGRHLGYCAGNDQPGYRVDEAPAGRGFGRGPGRGFGRGAGRGRGGRWSAPELATEQVVTTSLVAEVARLKEQLRMLEERLGNSKNLE